MGADLSKANEAVGQNDRSDTDQEAEEGELSTVEGAKPEANNMEERQDTVPTVFTLHDKALLHDPTSLYGRASRVSIRGSYDNWRSDRRLVSECKTGRYTVIHLPPGTYEYKYLVNGEWRTDNGKDVVRNVFGTYNNVITVTETDLEVHRAVGRACEYVSEVDDQSMWPNSKMFREEGYLDATDSVPDSLVKTMNARDAIKPRGIDMLFYSELTQLFGTSMQQLTTVQVANINFRDRHAINVFYSELPPCTPLVDNIRVFKHLYNINPRHRSIDKLQQSWMKLCAQNK